MINTQAPIAVPHPRWPKPVMAEMSLIDDCGGPLALTDVLVGAFGSMGDLVLPLRFAFHTGRGEEYRLHVAYVFAEHGRIGIRHIRREDRCVAEARLGRSGSARDGRKVSVSHA